MKSNDLKKSYEAVHSVLDGFFKSYPWEDKAVYSQWLSATFEYAVQSTRILALTAGFLPTDKTLHSNRFIAHAAEEKNHDKLLLADAKYLAFDLAGTSPSPEAEAFHKSLYFWIFNGRPMVIYGWILALEGFAVRHGGEVYSRCRKAHGDRACAFLKVHSEEDDDHLTKAFEAVAELPAKDVADVIHGLELYTKLYASMLEAAKAKAHPRSVRNAA